jgi:hypothetical protein
MIQFGILVKNISVSQHGLQLLYNLNLLVENYHDLSPVVFYETYHQLPYQPRFALIQNREAWLFDGPIISTSIDQVQIMLNCPKPNPKIFYIWNLDWIYQQNIPLSFLYNIYMNNKVALVARSKHHAKLIENCWQEPIDIIRDFNYHDIARIIKQTGRKLPDTIT